MIFALVSTLLSAPPPTGFTTAVERIALERTGPRVEARVDPLLRSIVLTGAKISGRLSSQLCPKQQLRGDRLELICTTRRLWATASEDERGAYLDVRALRGVTWHWERPAGIPLRTWPAEVLGLPERCPGLSEVVQAECLLDVGALFEAERLYTQGLSGPDAHLARLRLGDLALLRGDAEGALGWYGKVASAGPVSRIAWLRGCDLTGACLGQKPPTLEGLTGPIATEATLHVVRNELVVNHDLVAMQQLWALVEAGDPVCVTARAFCQKAVEAVLTDGDDEAVPVALAIFSHAGLGDGPDAVEVSLAAADAAEATGAPGFAAAVLASVSGRLPASALDAHLQRVARLYLLANDAVRAGFVLEYAEQRLSPAVLRTAPWRKLQRALAPKSTASRSAPRPTVAQQLPALSDEVELSRELARAAQLRAAAAQPIAAPAGDTP